MKNIIFIILCAFISSCTYVSKFNAQPNESKDRETQTIKYEQQLELNCIAIPNNNNQLCSVETESQYGPFDDVVFYKRDEEGYLFLLGSQKSYGQTFGSIEFSENGKYLYLSWAEEGHPQFHFYLTSKFLEGGIKADIIKHFEDYYLFYIQRLTDEGKLTYLADQQTINNCDKTQIQDGIKYCLVTINLTE